MTAWAGAAQAVEVLMLDQALMNWHVSTRGKARCAASYFAGLSEQEVAAALTCARDRSPANGNGESMADRAAKRGRA